VSLRSALAALLAALALLTAGCGGDDEKSGTDKARSESSGTPGTVPADVATDPQIVPEQTETVPSTTAQDNGGTKSPEKQRGGAGDEVPNATQALVTGQGGKLSPSAISVPPFIAIRVVLRSADGGAYTLRGQGRSLQAKGRGGRASSSFDGLRPGKSLKLSGPQGTVTVSANAEPGP